MLSGTSFKEDSVMAPERLARSTSGAAYGGIELKQLAHRYWMIAFGISLVLHLAIIAGYGVISLASPDHFIPPRPPVDGQKVIDWIPPGNPWTPTLPGGGGHIRARL
jgi:hypothetical protein